MRGKKRVCAICAAALAALMAFGTLCGGGTGLWPKVKTAPTAAEAMRAEMEIVQKGAKVEREEPQTTPTTMKAEKPETESTEPQDKEEAALTAALHAKAAALVDMDSGRVLYGKNAYEALPMASTTKIMTCILALEEGGREDMVTVSAYAAGQPKVRLGMQKGMSYRMDDLLHSLMLESHNDSAVAIAEQIGARELSLPEPAKRSKEQSREAVKVFCDKMTGKAREIGCKETCFLTPNGLDAEVETETGKKLTHSTTAADLAKIMRYCVTLSPERAAFLEITRTLSYSFTDGSGKQSYRCENHNAFLNMMDGALSGKTGFTSRAGYCYVGALEQDGERYALALLGCGWPGHKSWKWTDSRRLFSYGLENYEYREAAPSVVLEPAFVENGAPADGNPWHSVSVSLKKEEKALPLRLLMKDSERIEAQAELAKTLPAPVKEGTAAGCVSYYLVDGTGKRELLAQEAVYAGESVEKKDFLFMLEFVLRSFLP